MKIHFSRFCVFSLFTIHFCYMLRYTHKPRHLPTSPPTPTIYFAVCQYLARENPSPPRLVASPPYKPQANNQYKPLHNATTPPRRLLSLSQYKQG